MKFIKSLDMLGKEYQLKIEGDSFKTTFGGFFSILIYMATLVLTWYFGKDLYEKQNPKYITSNNYLEEHPVIGIDPSNFTFALSLSSNQDGKFIYDSRAFVYKAYYNRFRLDVKTNTRMIHEVHDISVEPCSNIVKEPFYTKGEFMNHYCPKFNGSYGGSALQEWYFVPHLRIDRCSPEIEKANNITCYTDEELINMYGRVLNVRVKYQNYYVNPTQFENPLIKSFDEIIYYVQTVESAYRANIYYSYARILTDSGLVFDDESHNHFFQFNEIDFQGIGKPNPEDVFLFNCGFKLTTLENYYYREYIKIPDILANVGGFMSIVMEIIQFVFSNYVDNEYNIFLYEKLFRLEIEKQDNESIGERAYDMVNVGVGSQIKNKTSNNSNNSNNINNIKSYGKNNNENNKDLEGSKDRILNNVNNVNNNNNLVNEAYSINKSKMKIGKKLIVNETPVNKELKNLIDYKKKKREPVIIGADERFCYVNCACCYSKSTNSKNNLRYELIAIAEQEIERKFDILEVLNSLNRLRLLQKILLNKSQCYMLANREIQTITNYKKNPSERVEDLNEIKEKQKIANLFNYLGIKKQENNFTNIDILLLKYLNEDLKGKIKQEIDIE